MEHKQFLEKLVEYMNMYLNDENFHIEKDQDGKNLVDLASFSLCDVCNNNKKESFISFNQDYGDLSYDLTLATEQHEDDNIRYARLLYSFLFKLIQEDSDWINEEYNVIPVKTLIMTGRHWKEHYNKRNPDYSLDVIKTKGWNLHEDNKSDYIFRKNESMEGYWQLEWDKSHKGTIISYFSNTGHGSYNESIYFNGNIKDQKQFWTLSKMLENL